MFGRLCSRRALWLADLSFAKVSRLGSRMAGTFWHNVSRIPLSSPTFSRRQTVVAVLLLLMTVLNYLDRQTLSIVAPLMLRDLEVSLTGYTQAINAFLVAYGVMYAGSGVILDRVGARAGLAIFVGFWSLFVSVRLRPS